MCVVWLGNALSHCSLVVGSQSCCTLWRCLEVDKEPYREGKRNCGPETIIFLDHLLLVSTIIVGTLADCLVNNNTISNSPCESHCLKRSAAAACDGQNISLPQHSYKPNP
jgi:hypothetical protein